MTRLRAGPSRFETLHKQIFLFLNSSRTNLRPTKASAEWVSVFFPDVNRPTRGVGNLPLPSAEIKKVWSYTPAPPIRLRHVDRENFPFVVL